jgi:hypothetical protein
MALLEYLKIHRDSPTTPAGYRATDCGLVSGVL